MSPPDRDDDHPLAGGMPDLGGLLESAKQMMQSAQAAADAVVEGQASGGLVSVRVDGHFHFESVHIEPGAIDPDDPSLLEDLVLAALRDASAKLRAGRRGALGGLELGGGDLGDLGDLLGGGT
ncbi:MAG: YbaB/EbfC family nucleoid-associated protein [Acidimicrobiales bacterium]